MERALTLWRDGYITLESVASEKKGKCGIRKTINEFTGKESKATDFNHTNWRMGMETNAYLASIKVNLANRKLVWNELISAAAAFAKLGAKMGDDSMATFDDGAEDERAHLVADSDSNSD